MKRSGGDGIGGGIGNGSFGVTMSLSPSSSSISNNDNKMMIQLPESPTSALGSLSLQERDREQQQQQCAAASTTFVHVDTCNFREVVQKLTGASDNDGLEKFPITLPSRQAARAAAAAAGGGDKLADNTYGGLIPKPVGDLSARRPAFKLHERRQSFLLRKLDVKGLGLPSGLRRGTSGGYGSSAAAVCSPTSELSPRFNPSLMSSPVTPLTMNVFENNNAGSNGNGCAPTTPNSYDVYTCLRPRETQAQELLERGAGGEAGGGGSPAAAAGSREERFFLHSSPTLERPRQLPELLTLFPLTSPRASEPS